MFARFLAWLQKTPVFFRVAFTFVALLMAGALLFTFLPGSHDAVGAGLGIVAWLGLLVWKRKVMFGPKLPS